MLALAYRAIFSALLLITLMTAARAQDAAPDRPLSPIEAHFAHMLTGSGQWRTPNEDYDPEDPNGMSEYGADYRLSDDGTHVIAEITGVTPDGRRAVFWTIYFIHNPVTGEIVSSQVGWNGALLTGNDMALSEPLGFGEGHVSDQLAFNPDGSIRIIRHEIVSVDAQTHTTQTYGRGERGAWEPQNFRTWTLLETE